MFLQFIHRKKKQLIFLAKKMTKNNLLNEGNKKVLAEENLG